MPTPLALALSPHLDDAVFSCGGTLAALRRRGWRVVVATIFTASVPDPSGFALACQLDKGLPPEVDYLALRRLEDAEAGRALGVAVEWLGLPEAPHRGYDSAPALFAGVRDDDPIGPEVGRVLDLLAARHDPALILAPRGIGNHVDHLQVVRAVLDRPGLLSRTAWFRDLPYAARFPAAGPAPGLPEAMAEALSDLDPGDLRRKLDASACYASQVGFQFGGVGPMEALLSGFARAEGDRLGSARPAEAFFAAGPSSALFTRR